MFCLNKSSSRERNSKPTVEPLKLGSYLFGLFGAEKQPSVLPTSNSARAKIQKVEPQRPVPVQSSKQLDSVHQSKHLNSMPTSPTSRPAQLMTAVTKLRTNTALSPPPPQANRYFTNANLNTLLKPTQEQTSKEISSTIISQRNKDTVPNSNQVPLLRVQSQPTINQPIPKKEHQLDTINQSMQKTHSALTAVLQQQLSIDRSNQVPFSQQSSRLNNESNKKVESPKRIGQEVLLQQVSDSLSRRISPQHQMGQSLTPYYVSDVKSAMVQRKSGSVLSKEQEQFAAHITKSFEMLKQIKPMRTVPDQKKSLQLLQYGIGKLDLHKKTLILDLDETLIHTFPVDKPTSTFHLKIRPFVLEFLRETKRFFNLIIFTASDKRYSEQIIRKIDPQSTLFNMVLYRDCCLEIQPRILVKDLSLLGIDLSQVVIVDNTTLAFALNLSNGIPIIPYYDDENDTQLRKLLIFLQYEVLPANDVRNVITSRFKFAELAKYRDLNLALQMLYEV